MAYIAHPQSAHGGESEARDRTDLLRVDGAGEHPTPKSIPQPEFISVPDLARRLRRSKESVYQACRRGEIPGSFLIGRLWQVNWTAFVAATETANGSLAEVEP